MSSEGSTVVYILLPSDDIYIYLVLLVGLALHSDTPPGCSTRAVSVVLCSRACPRAPTPFSPTGLSDNTSDVRLLQGI